MNESTQNNKNKKIKHYRVEAAGGFILVAVKWAEAVNIVCRLKGAKIVPVFV